jgi:hypothetical protein
MLSYYKGYGYVFEYLIENAIRMNFPTIKIFNEYEIKKRFGSYKTNNKNINGVDLFCFNNNKYITIQAKLVSSPPSTKSISDFLNTSLMIENKVCSYVKKIYVTTQKPYNPGLIFCNNNDICLIHNNQPEKLISDLIINLQNELEQKKI